jgi:hypothetical protein
MDRRQIGLRFDGSLEGNRILRTLQYQLLCIEVACPGICISLDKGQRCPEIASFNLDDGRLRDLRLVFCSGLHCCCTLFLTKLETIDPCNTVAYLGNLRQHDPIWTCPKSSTYRHPPSSSSGFAENTGRGPLAILLEGQLYRGIVGLTGTVPHFGYVPSLRILVYRKHEICKKAFQLDLTVGMESLASEGGWFLTEGFRGRRRGSQHLGINFNRFHRKLRPHLSLEAPQLGRWLTSRIGILRMRDQREDR